MKATGGIVFRFAASMACVALAGCMGGGTDTPQRLSAVQQCGQLTNNFGPAFFCGSNQANLNNTQFQDGAHGFCMFTNQNLSTVGYSATTNNGGAFPVTTQSQASSDCSLVGYPSNCNGYVQCTRICAAGVSNCTGF